MRLTTRGRYAVTALLDLALHAAAPGCRGTPARPVTLAEVAARQHISVAYLEQLFARLRRAGLVESVRGPGGGYCLTRPASGVAEIIDAVDEVIDATRCAGRGGCDDGELCLTHELWSDLTAEIHAFLGGISVADLIERRAIRAVARRQDQGTHAERIPAQAV